MEEFGHRGRWEIVGSDKGLRSVHLHATNCSADEAAQQAVDLVLEKYGKGTDLSRWTFSVWPGTFSASDRLAYRVDAQGRAVRF